MDIQKSFLEACREGDIEKVKSLFEKGVDIETKNNALIYSSWHGYIEIVRLLLEEGVDIENKNNKEVRTPLIAASCKGHIEIVKLLLEKGADIKVRNIYGKTFYNYLGEKNKKEIDFLLKDIQERKRMIKPCSFLATYM